MTFPADQIYCVLDYETYSEADLKKVGAFEYANHPSTEIMCAAWAVGTREELKTAEIQSWAVGEPLDKLIDLALVLRRDDVVIVAHNALFEQLITQHVLFQLVMVDLAATLGWEDYSIHDFVIPVNRWICTAALAATLAVPRDLARAGAALDLSVQKDGEGHRLMMKMSKPRKPTKHDKRTRHLDPDDLTRLVAYCVTDIASEIKLFLKCPPLTPTERRVWILDQEINQRGFLVDRPLVLKALEMIDTEITRIDRATVDLTGGEVTSTRKGAAMLKWLEAQGCYLPDYQKQTIEDALSSGLATGVAREMLEYRQAVAKTSTAKYVAFELRSRTDGRLRDILAYHAASTGRWGGRGVQPQNFPKGTLEDPDQAAEVMAAGDLELLRLLYGSPMDAMSSCLRSMIIAPPGRVLDVADYAAIEARVLAWIAGDARSLQLFRDKVDPYKDLATLIFGVRLESVTKDQRFLGKQAKLGCGYQMGHLKYIDMCATYGVTVAKDTAELVVNGYRENHPEVVQTWSNMQQAAIAAVEQPRRRFMVNKVTWVYVAPVLWCILPSGRRLAYIKPSVRYTDTPWGEKRLTLFHYAENPRTHQWEETKTYGGLLTENVVQAIARDLMAEAMLRIAGAGPWDIVFSVHDELVAERAEEAVSATNAEFCKLMKQLPPWATGCPIEVEGWEGKRYKK